MRKALVKSYGCQMNAYDSERMQDLLAGQGYGLTEAPEEADLIVLNTCHIREKAAEKIYSELGLIRQIKQERAASGREMIVAVAGCVAQAEGEEIVRRQKAVDLVFGPQSYHRLPQLLEQHRSSGRAVIETAFPADEKFASLSETAQAMPARGRQVAAFLTVQEGCDKFCSFCVVPYTRGAEYSRPVAAIISEAQKLVRQGVREITLLGQNVNAYRGVGQSGDAASLAELVTELSLIPDIQRIRYTTSHPRDMTDDLIEAHASNAKLMPYLHLPVQAGSDKVLKAMNRGHTAEAYLRLIERVRKARPDIAISGDFITGFPGETEADFENTLALVRDVQYASSFSFKYSPRPGTPAASRSDQVPEEEKLDRLHRLQALLTRQMQDFNHACVGRSLPVLVEKPGRHPGQMIGRSPYLQPVVLEGSQHAPGDMVKTEITGIRSNSLLGQFRRVAA